MTVPIRNIYLVGATIPECEYALSSVMLNYAGEYCEYAEYCGACHLAETVPGNYEQRRILVLVILQHLDSFALAHTHQRPCGSVASLPNARVVTA